MSLKRVAIILVAMVAVLLFTLFAVWMFQSLSELGPVTSPG